MALTANVQQKDGRPVLMINDQPTTEFWCYSDPNAIADFAAGDICICQFPVPAPSWWRGVGEYDFELTRRKMDEFLAAAPDLLLMPRVGFGHTGESWWSAAHPDHLSVGCDLDEQPVDYATARAKPADCWQSTGSQRWTDEAAEAMAAFVTDCEQHYADKVVGYHIGGGISTEWFRWWAFVEDVYEDYSPAARDAFRAFLKNRYGDDAALRDAWGRTDVTLADAVVPSPRRLHTPLLGFFRDPRRERDVLDWLEYFNQANATQLLTLADAAKRACGGKKLVGAFFGYLWGHWNTRNPARQGHLDLRRVLNSDSIDFISSPYHYDNRHNGGFHHSQTVPQAIERAGKLHLDEIDTPTHLTDAAAWFGIPTHLPRSLSASCKLLRRDAAAILGTAGSAWWMDLYHSRWYGDAGLHDELRDLQQLARQVCDWKSESHADVALVIDDRSYAYGDLHGPLNQYFAALPRQFEWSALGFPIDTLLLSELTALRPYKLYVFLNCWCVETAQRQAIHERVRKNGMNSLWFYGAGYTDGVRCDDELVSELVGIDVYSEADAAVPEIKLHDSGHPLIEQSLTTPRGATQFGARLTKAQQSGLNCGNPQAWDTTASPIFIVDDGGATVLGSYLHDGSPGMAVREQDGWCSVYCGAPMLPGWMLRRVAECAGAHMYAPLGFQVWQRGPLVAVYKPGDAGEVTLSAPIGQTLTPIVPKGSARHWRPDTAIRPGPQIELEFVSGETKFFRTGA